jgi:hypothetical protein
MECGVFVHKRLARGLCSINLTWLCKEVVRAIYRRSKLDYSYRSTMDLERTTAL